MTPPSTTRRWLALRFALLVAVLSLRALAMGLGRFGRRLFAVLPG